MGPPLSSTRSRPVGYDAHAAGNGLVIHKIDTSQAVGLTRFAYVVDSDNNGNPNNAGARWTAGETYTDSTNKISVQVTGASTNGYNVNIKNNAGGGTAPPNDNFGDAQTVSGGSVTGSNTNATKETGEPRHAYNSSFDTLLGVYTGSAVNSLSWVTYNDDVASGTTWSRATFSATAGTPYQIAVDGYRYSTGAASGNVSVKIYKQQWYPVRVKKGKGKKKRWVTRWTYTWVLASTAANSTGGESKQSGTN